MGFGAVQLRDKTLAAVEEAAAEAMSGPVQRSKALAFALAYLWAYGSGSREPFDRFWKDIAHEYEIGRRQSVNASLNGIYRALGLDRG